MGKRNIGSDFDAFLKEEGLLEETTAVAVKRSRKTSRNAARRSIMAAPRWSVI